MANEDKATRYQRLRRRASLAGVAGVGLVLGLAMLAGSSEPADPGSTTAQLIALTGAAFGLLAGCAGVTFLPAFYREARLTRRYGVLRESPGAWVKAWIPRAAAHVGIGTVAVVVCAGLRAVSPAWWWAVGGAVAGLAPFAVAALVQRATRRRPTGTPLASGALRGRLTRLAADAGLPDLGLYQTHVGERTRLANAAVVTVGRERRVLLSDTLLADHSDEEVEAVVAHELAHIAHHDVVASQAALAAHVAVSLYAVELTLRWLSPASPLITPAGLPSALLAGGCTFLLFRPLTLALSRRQEREADRYAVTLGGNPGALASVVRRIAANHLAEPSPSSVTVWLFHSHPSAAERISAANRIPGPAHRRTVP